MAEKARILIVDDMADARNLLRLILGSRGGYDTLEAGHGQEALEQAWQYFPDLIVLDYMMPDLDGIEVCKRLRADSRTANTPIMMFTARTGQDTKIKAFDAGVDALLFKPLQPRELLDEIAQLLAARQTA